MSLVEKAWHDLLHWGEKSCKSEHKKYISMIVKL